MEEYPDSETDTCPYCGYRDGSTQDISTALLTGTILQGRYIVGTVIKVRSVDVFYHGWDALFDRKVCIQEYLPCSLAEHDKSSQVSVFEGSEETFQRGLKLFIRDGRELIRLYREPDIVTVHACFEENGTAYTILDREERDTLELYLVEEHFPEDTALLLLKMAVQAVKKCHRLGVWHGMISPEVFVCTETGLLLRDFAPWRMTVEAGADDTPENGYETDVHDLAALFYRLATGDRYDGDVNVAASLKDSGAGLSDYVITATEQALNHEIGTIDRFEEALHFSEPGPDEEPVTLDWESSESAEQKKGTKRITTASRVIWSLCLIAAVILIVLIVLKIRQGSGL